MTHDLRSSLEDLVAEGPPDHSPHDLARAAWAQGRRRRHVRQTVVAVLVLVLLGAGATGTTLVASRIGMTGDTPVTSAHHLTTGPAASPGLPTQTVSLPHRPAPVTMQTVRRIGRAQEFRPYSGPKPPKISEAEALRRGESPDDYSLGLWDVGLVSEGTQGTTVEWHSVWIIAAENFVTNRRLLGGGMVEPGVTTSPPKTRPGWVRSVTMLDARTGKFVLGYGF